MSIENIFTIFFLAAPLIIIARVIWRATYSNDVRCPSCRKVFRTDADKLFIDYKNFPDEDNVIAICRKCSKEGVDYEKIYNFLANGRWGGTDTSEIIEAIRTHRNGGNDE